jgi:hypothetical protein
MPYCFGWCDLSDNGRGWPPLRDARRDRQYVVVCWDVVSFNRLQAVLVIYAKKMTPPIVAP